MGLDVVYGVVKNSIAIENFLKSLSAIPEIDKTGNTVFLGYPLTAKVEESITVDALLVTREKGVLAFIIHEKEDNDEERQDKMYYDLDYAFSKYEKLRKGRKLAFSPQVLTYFCDAKDYDNTGEYLYVNDKNLKDAYIKLPDFDSNYYNILCESLYKISSMKPRKKRLNVQKPDSKGAKIKIIEKQIANLDEWQKKAAYEVPDGPQQIRGLAGSGKTIVLALKAAYLHSQHPEWNIIVTYYTRSLKQQYRRLITNFMTEFSDEKPDWNKLQIIHAWGTNSELGVYSLAARQIDVTPYDYVAAKQRFGEKYAFRGICKELLDSAQDSLVENYDAILIDEAQDLPEDFFRLCYKIANKEKRVVFAYDELQNLNNLESISVENLFGVNEDGSPKEKFSNEDGKPRQDIVLPICYRNTKWALTVAHALGFGIYREKGMIQAFSTPSTWKDIGYEVKTGQLKRNCKVKLQRGDKSTPEYFRTSISPEDAFQSKAFKTEAEQYIWLSNEIKKNIEQDELDPDDILVIFPDAYYSQSSYNLFKRFLAQNRIESILAGVTTDRDTFKVEGAITCASIYRAKGNEFPMVYVVNAQSCYENSDIITARNIIFTAITRARAWVRVYGYGEDMVLFDREIQKCINNDYILEFKNPTEPELEKMRSLYKVISKENADLIDSSERQIKRLIDLVKKGEIKKEDLSKLSDLFDGIDE